MAVTKRSGSGRVTQHPTEAPASEILSPLSRHVRIFEAAANLNRGFDLVLNQVEKLKALGQFRGEFTGQFAKSCRLALEELRSWAIFEITEDLHERPQDDWARYGRLRLRWENKFRDPEDLFAEAERLKKKLVGKAAKKHPGEKGRTK
jgi:hypothetical protein